MSQKARSEEVIDPSGRRYWDRVAPRYLDLYDSPWSRFEDDVLRRDLLHLLPQVRGKVVLDIGCGMGLAYELLGGSGSGASYVGLDISPEMLRALKTKHAEVFVIEGSGDQLPPVLHGRRFDAVLSTNVAASFPLNTAALLRGVFDVLAPGGVFYLSFLNRWSLRRLRRGLVRRSEHYRTRGDSQSQEAVMANVFSGRDLRQMCESVGFVDPQVAYRSVLGGVWETPTAVRIETFLMRTVPFFGHSVAVFGSRRP